MSWQPWSGDRAHSGRRCRSPKEWSSRSEGIERGAGSARTASSREPATIRIHHPDVADATAPRRCLAAGAHPVADATATRGRLAAGADPLAGHRRLDSEEARRRWASRTLRRPRNDPVPPCKPPRRSHLGLAACRIRHLRRAPVSGEPRASLGSGAGCSTSQLRVRTSRPDRRLAAPPSGLRPRVYSPSLPQAVWPIDEAARAREGWRRGRRKCQERVWPQATPRALPTSQRAPAPAASPMTSPSVLSMTSALWQLRPRLGKPS